MPRVGQQQLLFAWMRRDVKRVVVNITRDYRMHEGLLNAGYRRAYAWMQHAVERSLCG